WGCGSARSATPTWFAPVELGAFAAAACGSRVGHPAGAAPGRRRSRAWSTDGSGDPPGGSGVHRPALSAADGHRAGDTTSCVRLEPDARANVADAAPQRTW